MGRWIHWLAVGASMVGVGVATHMAIAADLRPADIAWIEKCIADRKLEELDPTPLRKYCACMQDIVEDNEPFTVTELERSYPPAHLMCTEKAGLLR